MVFCDRLIVVFKVFEIMIGSLVVVMICSVCVILFSGCVLMMRRFVVLVCVIVRGFEDFCMFLLVVMGMFMYFIC